MPACAVHWQLRRSPRSSSGDSLSATDQAIIWTSNWLSETANDGNHWGGIKYAWVGHDRIRHAVAPISLSPDGRWVMLVEPGRATVWDTATRQIRATTPFTGVFQNMLFATDNAWLVTSQGATVQLQNVLHAQTVTWQGPSPLKSIVLNGPKQLLAAIYPAGIVILHGFDGRVRAKLSQSSEVIDCMFSQAGTLLATNDAQGVVRIWDVATSKERYSIQGLNFQFDQFTFAAGGERLFVRNDTDLQVLNAATGVILAKFDSHKGFGPNLIISPDRSRMVTTNNESTRATLWDISAPTMIKVAELRHQAWIRKVVFNADGALIATAALDGTARLWNAETGDLVKTFSDDSALTDAIFSPDSNFLVTKSENYTVRTWPVSNADPVFTVHDREATADAFHFSGACKKLVVDGEDGLRHVYQLSAQSQQTFSTTAKLGKSVVSLDQQLLVTLCNDHCLQLRKMDSGQLVKTLSFTNTVDQATFSPDGRYLVTLGVDDSVSWEKRGSAVDIWRLPSGEHVAQLPHEGEVRGLGFSPDGRLLATSSIVLRGVSGLINSNVQVWQVADGVLRTVFAGPINVGLDAIAFTDQATVLALYEDGTLHEWPIETAQLVKAACQKLSRNLTEREWLTFVGSATPYRATCP